MCQFELKSAETDGQANDQTSFKLNSKFLIHLFYF